MSVIDGDEAAVSPMGRWALAVRSPGLVPAALCLRTDDADNEAARLGLEPTAMSRTRPDGIVLSWRLVGADDMFGNRRLPFYIQWDDMALHPGRSIAHHRVNPLGIEEVVLSGDTAAIHRRIGGADVPVTVVPGLPGVRSVTIMHPWSTDRDRTVTAGGPRTCWVIPVGAVRWKLETGNFCWLRPEPTAMARARRSRRSRGRRTAPRGRY